MNEEVDSETERRRDPGKRAAVSYGFAFLCVAAALALTQLLGDWAKSDFTALYVLVVLLATSVSGLRAGLLATVLSAVIIAYMQVGWVKQPDLGWDDLLRTGVFILAALVVSSLAARRRDAEEKLRAAVAQLRRDDRAKDEFLATLSHELKTPLTSILGWSALLAEGDPDPSLVAAATESITGSARSQQHLIDELLDVSRIMFEKFTIEKAPVDLVHVAREIADVIRPASVKKRVVLDVDLPARSCVIEGDEYRIKQLISNLLSNAVKFTPTGGWIALRLEVRDSQARVVVRDTGEGIDPAFLPRLFDRFQQGEGATAKGGLGLGPAIARHVVEAHHGSLAAFSLGRGKGATFTATFPLATAELRKSA